MAYIVPSVQVYQSLANPGGALAATPDLNTVIVGPLYNVVRANLTDPSDFERSKTTRTDFVFGAPEGESESYIKEVELPSKILGQKLDETSLKIVFKDAWVKINNFTADADLLSGDDTSTLTVSTGSEEFNFSDTAFDGNLYIKKGDRVEYGVTIGSTLVNRVTTVRDFNISGVTKTVQLSNGVGTVDIGQGEVTFDVYRFFASIELPVDTDPDLGNVFTDEANTTFTLRIDSSSSVNAIESFHTVGMVSSMHIGYRALRTDKSQTVLAITSELNRESVLGEATEQNPMSLAVQLALANTTGVIKALSVQSNDASGYAIARDVLESDSDVYALVPLTQELSILSAFQAHVGQLSTPVEASWRVLLANVKIPSMTHLAGQEDNPASGYVRQFSAVPGGRDEATFIIDPDVDFLTAGVVPTDILTIAPFVLASGQVLPSGTTAQDFIGSWVVSAVIDSNTVQVVPAATDYVYDATVTTPQSNGQFIPYTITRILTLADQAKYISDVSFQFNDKRVWHIQPDSVTVEVNGVGVPNLPGYYLCAAMGGMVSGFPVQQGFTNIGVAGIMDLQHSNYYFTRSDLNKMAETGTCLFVQAVQGGIPYCRHEMTTDVTVLEYREMLKVKNWDFLSYFYYDKLKSFIGKYNITADTLNDIRATLIASSELLMTQKLPRIGAPLVGYEIVTLEQDPINKDRIRIKIRIEIVSPANYIDITLEI